MRSDNMTSESLYSCMHVVYLVLVLHTLHVYMFTNYPPLSTWGGLVSNASCFVPWDCFCKNLFFVSIRLGLIITYSICSHPAAEGLTYWIK